MATVSGDSSLNFSGQFDITQILANQDKVIQGFNEVKKSAETNLSNSSSNSSLSDEKQASLDRQNSLRDERLLIIANKQALEDQAIAQIKLNNTRDTKRPTLVSNSQDEVDAYNSSKQLTSALNDQDIAQAKIANSATAVTSAINDQISAQGKSNLTTKQSAQLLAEEKVIQANNTAQLKNNAREQLNAKGSIEQRRAALIRLNSAYDKLSADDRDSASGQRLKSIIGGVTDQVKELEVSTGRAQRNVGNYTKSFTNGLNSAWGGLRKIAQILPGIGVAGLLAFAVEPLMEYITNLDIFKKQIDQFAEGKKQLNDVNVKGAQNAQLEVVQLKTLYDTTQNTTLSIKQRNDAADELQKKYPNYLGNISNESILAGNAASAYDRLTQSIIATAKARASQDKIAENSSRQLDNDQKVIDLQNQALKDKLELSKKIKNAEPTAAAGSAGVGAAGGQGEASLKASSEKRQKDIQKNIQDIKTDSKLLENRNKALAENIVVQQKNGAVLTSPQKDNKSAYESALKQQRALQREIQDLINGSTKKQLSADDAEVQSVTDKYKKMRDKAIEFNNSTIAKKQGLKTDISGLKPAEIAEKQAIIDKQSNERFRANLSLQTKDFEDVENYRLKYGEDAAKERYTKEYNITSEAYDKQFSSAEIYAQKLEDIQTNILNKYGDPTGYSEAQKQELDIATKEIQSFAAKRKTIDDGIYDNAYQAALTNTQKLASIDEDYQRKKKALGDKATTEQLDNLTREKEDKIRAANEANADQKSGYATLLQNLDGMSRGKVIDELNREKDYWTKQYTDKLITAKKYTDEIAQLNGQIDSLTGNNIFNKIGESIKRYKDAKKAFDDKADGSSSIAVENAQKEMYSTIAEGAEAAATAVSGLGSIFDQLGIGGEKLQTVMKDVSGILSGAGEIAKGIASKDPVAIVTGSIKLLSSAIDLFNNKDKNLQAKIDGYKKQLDILGQAYKQLDRDVQNAVGNDIYSTQAAQIANLKDQQDQLIKIRDAESQKKKKDQSKIDDLNSQIDDIPNKIDDINKAISQELIQGTFQDLSNSLADALTNAFQAGADGIDALNQTFDDFIANAIKNSLKLAILEPITKQFTDELTKYAQGNGNSVLGFDFDAWKKKLDDAGQAFNDGLKESESLFKSPDTSAPVNTGTLTGAFATASQQSIDLLSGQTGGMRLAQLETNAILKPIGQSVVDFYNLAKDNFTIQLKIEANTNRTANNTDRLENIEVALVSIDKKMNSNSSYLAGTGR